MPPSSETAADGRQSYTFPRSHRLKRQRLIRSLFDRRRTDVGTEAMGSVRLLYRVVSRAETGYDVSLQIGFAPGRRTRNAVERNRVRRLLREVYRAHQHLLTSLFRDDPEHALVVMALFRGNPRRAAERLPRDLPEAMRRLSGRVREGERERG